MALTERRPWPGGLLQPGRGIALFWRTLLLQQQLLLLACIALWLGVFISLEIAPQAVREAHQLASLVNLSRAGLRASDPIGRWLLIKTLADEQGLAIAARRPQDRFELMPEGPLTGAVVTQLRDQLGGQAIVARSVNDQPGLWIGFDIEGDDYWLRTDPTRLMPARAGTWLLWLLVAALFSLLGSVLITRIINRPLHRLADASALLQGGRVEQVHLDEQAATREIREVNIAFNRMSEQLARLDQERKLLLAGIAHDLRTPLARLRLEAELSVPDPRAREHMVADMAQLEAIVDRFVSQSTPEGAPLQAVALDGLIDQACFALADDPHMHIERRLEPGLKVLADPVGLLRVLGNLLENARLYGRSSDGVCHLDLVSQVTQAWVVLTLTDHGPGVAADQLHQLTRPYFRAQAGPSTDRQAHGLGLAIVESSMLRMGGALSLSLAEHGGLCASLRLRRA